jgi:hypothetical protein
MTSRIECRVITQHGRKFDKLKWLGVQGDYTYGGDLMTFPTQLSPSVSTGKTASSWLKRTLDGQTQSTYPRDDRACKPAE